MILSESAQKSLDFIRHFVVKQQYDLNSSQKAALKDVYEDIQGQIGKPRKLDTSCAGCVKTAINICKNFMDFHEKILVFNEKKVIRIEEPSDVERKTVIQLIEPRVDLKQLTVEQLQDICKEQSIKFHHKSKEASLISLILSKQNEAEVNGQL